VGLAVLLTFNPFAIMLGMGSLAVVAAYPFMKRITSWPQFVLGLAFSWGGLMGWAGQFGSLEWPAVALYAGAVFWTMGYDTIYAVQDFEDDAIAGIRSTARLFGARTKLAIAILYGLASFCLAAALWGGHAGPVAWIGLAAFVTHLVRQVTKVSLADPSGALRLFRSNRDAGLLLFAGLCLDAVLRGA
jgi:4-hydroxybenzoate polyprenyltransferase